MSDGSEQISCPDVGGILKRQREHQSLTVQQVAAELHLRPSVIVSIESNAFEDVPGVTFLRGYVKSYARLLKLSESEISDLLQQALDYDKNISQRKLAENESANSGSSGTLYALLLIVILVGAGVWLYQSGNLDNYLNGEREPVAEMEMNIDEASEEVDSASSSQVGDYELGYGESVTNKESPASPDVGADVDIQEVQVSFDQPQSDADINKDVTVMDSAPESINIETADSGGVLPEDADLDELTVDDVNAGNNSAQELVNVERSIPSAGQEFVPTSEGNTIESVDGAIDQPETVSELPPIEVVSETEIAGSDDAGFGAQSADVIPDTPEVEVGAVEDDVVEATVVEATVVEATVAEENVVEATIANVPDEADDSSQANDLDEVEKVFGELKASFSGDCWFQVKNGDGRTVIASLKKSGQESSYRGPLPFTVVIGAVSEVSMTFNDQSVDFSQFRVRNNRTDFVLE